jgi:Ca2+-binding EF-hand superfamily protein
LLALVAGMFLSLSWADAADGAAKKKKGKKGNPAELFKKLDSNNDSKLSKEEFSKFGKEPTKTKRTDKLFGKLDANNDGSLSADELKKISEQRKKKKKDSNG